MLRKIALAIASASLALAGVELFLRVADLRVMSLHRGLQKLAEMEVFDTERNLLTGPSNTDAVLLGYDTHFNSLGVRDGEPALPKPKGRFRILVLGDSVVFGQGVEQKDMLAEVLRSEIHAPDVDVVSAGIPGWRTVDEEQFLLKNLDAIDPDLVVLVYVENDNEPIDPFQKVRFAPHGFGAQVYRTLLLHSRTFEWGVYIWRSRIGGAAQSVLDEAARWQALVAAQGPPFAPTDPGWIASREALTRMHRLLGSRGGRLAVFLFDLGTIPPAAPIHDRLREVSRDEKIPLFETRPFFAGHVPASLMNSKDDPHPNREGHQLLGRGIARTLSEQGLLPSGAKP